MSHKCVLRRGAPQGVSRKSVLQARFETVPGNAFKILKIIKTCHKIGFQKQFKERPARLCNIVL